MQEHAEAEASANEDKGTEAAVTKRERPTWIEIAVPIQCPFKCVFGWCAT